MGDKVFEYYYDAQGIIAFKYDGAVYYFKKNLMGDIDRIYDANKNLVAEYKYDAWGNHRVYTGTGIDITDNSSYNNSVAKLNPFRYRGYYYDTETGLYYLNSRYYDPSIGRFINADDISYIQPTEINGLNLFAYCGNNPVMYVDPTGQFPLLALILGLVAIAGLGLIIGGVASDNNALTAAGLTMVAVPALISGGMAIAAGISGATLTGIIGGVTVAAGVGSGVFASAEYQQAFTGDNWMLDAGMSEDLYNGLMLSLATIATLGTIASSFAFEFNIKAIKGIGRYSKYGQKGYWGIKFTNSQGKIRVLTFHTHSHVAGKTISQWHWQLQKWNEKVKEVAGTIARWIWWNFRRF